MRLAALEQSPIKGLQPGIAAAYGCEGWHPQRLAKSSITNRGKRRALGSTLAGLVVSRTKAGIGGQRASTLEASGITEFGDQTSSRIVANPANRRQKFADLMLLKLGRDIAVELLKARTQRLEIFAGITHPELMSRRVLTANRDLGCVDQLLRQFGADPVTAVITKMRQTMARKAVKRLRRRILAQDRGCELSIKFSEIVVKLGKA